MGPRILDGLGPSISVEAAYKNGEERPVPWHGIAWHLLRSSEILPKPPVELSHVFSVSQGAGYLDHVASPNSSGSPLV